MHTPGNKESIYHPLSEQQALRENSFVIGYFLNLLCIWLSRVKLGVSAISVAFGAAGSQVRTNEYFL